MRSLYLCATALLCAGLALCRAEEVTVTGNGVCLRAAALPTAEVVMQADKGATLEAISSLDGEWVKIVPPAEADFWIYTPLLERGVVGVARAMIRAGAGTSFSAVGQVSKGTRIVERGRLGDWTKIAPPDGTALWINRHYVAVEQNVEPRTENIESGEELVRLGDDDGVSVEDPEDPEIAENVEATEETVTIDVAQTPVDAKGEGRRTLFNKDRTINTTPPAEPERIPEGIVKSRLDLNYVQGTRGTYRGTLVLSGMTGTTPSRFRLVVNEGRTKQHVCFVLGQEEQLNALLDRAMTIEGGVYRFKYSDSPVILAERIRLQP
ncbi:MAG: SH3 domain-containing protein [Kiritimatiellaeota bacterium]|nr:SH3 domain-containing protein [Kiritimatiellota bacterium]